MSPVKPNSHSSKQQKFNLQNLEPINYLKTFNKMLEHINKPSTQLLDSSKELKTVRLSKFPLHSYYEQMQGILQGGGKKLNQAQKASKKEAELQQLEEKFLNKHYTFVKGALEKIIQDNEAQQNLLLKSKNFYQTNQLKRTGSDYEAEIVKMVKLRSQPKLRSIKTTIDSARKTLQQNNSRVENYSSVHTLNNTTLSKRKHTKNDSERSMESKNKNKRKATLNQETAKDIKTQYSSLTKDQTRKKKNSLSQHQSVNNEEEHNPIFKKLKQPQKIQKFRKRNQNEVDFILTARKTLMDPKIKNSLDSIHALTQRTHQNPKKTDLEKPVDLRKNEANQLNTAKVKFKNTLRQKNSQNEENDQENFFNSDELSTFRREISHKSHKKRKSDSMEKESFREECQDQDEKFINEVEFLQKQKTKRQQKYANLVEDKIKQVKHKLNQKISEVKKFDYSAPKESPKTKHKKESS